MIKIPEEIQIGGITFKVKWEKEIGPGLVAQIHYRTAIIEILDDLSEEVAFASFIHELQHGVFGTQNYDLNEMIYHDENLVETSAQLWSQVIKQIVACNLMDNSVDVEKVENKDLLRIPSLEGF